MSDEYKHNGKPNFIKTNPSLKRPSEQMRGKGKSNTRGNPR